MTSVNLVMAEATKLQAQAGYECSFVEELSSDLQSECSVCLHVLREPYIVSCCGYRFCRGCIEKVLKTTRRCPLCTKGFSTLPDKHLERVLNDKNVYCVNKSSGCKWKGKLIGLEEHVGKCTWQKVSCPYCKETFTKYNYTKFHKDTCSLWEVQCTYCKNCSASQPMLESVHYVVCPKYPVPCPNNCGVKPLRKNISTHVNDNCPLTVVDCLFQYAGCTVRLTRRQMQQHQGEENLSEHLVMTMSKIKELKDENSHLREQLDFKEAELKLLKLKLQDATESTMGSVKTKPVKPTATGSIKHLCATNLPECVNESMLRSVFGQFGSVKNISLQGNCLAQVEYQSQKDFKRALSRNQSAGINLKSCRLVLTPVYESF